MSSLIKFIENGFIEEIHLGMKRWEVENLLGKPQDRSVSKKPFILKYDSIQLSFDSDRREDQLRSIHVYFSDNVEFPESLKIKGWVPDKDMEFKKFMHEIETFKVQLLRDDKHTLENTQLGFRSQAGVVLIFVIEGEMARLDSFHLSDFLIL